MYQPTDVVTTLDDGYKDVPRPYPSQTSKIIDRIDDHIRVWIERSTFMTIATVDAHRRMDVSPKRRSSRVHEGIG